MICASNEPNEYACIFTRRMPQQPTECWLPQSWSAPNHTGDATPSPLRFGRCRANVHWTFCTPALAAASYPFVDLPSGDTLRCKLFPADKFYKISLYFEGRIKYNEVNEKSEIVLCQAPVGAAAATQILEWLIGYGVCEIISAGSCGALEYFEEGTFLVPVKHCVMKGLPIIMLLYHALWKPTKKQEKLLRKQ